MSEAAFTPGPWRAGRDGNLRVYGPDGQGEHSGLIAEVFKGRGNVNLITAAPELLAALEEITDAYASLVDSDYGGRRDPNPSKNYADVLKARAVIAKARGEA